jgi:hypothetical protein
MHSTSEDISWTVCVLLCSWECSGSFCVITVSTVQLQTEQFVQYLYSKCVVLLYSWTCSSSFCVITVSTIQLQTEQFVQYLYSKCAVLFCSWTCCSSFCVTTVSTVKLQTVQFVQNLYSKCVVLLCSWTCSSSFCVITVNTVQLLNVQYMCCTVGQQNMYEQPVCNYCKYISFAQFSLLLNWPPLNMTLIIRTTLHNLLYNWPRPEKQFHCVGLEETLSEILRSPITFLSLAPRRKQQMDLVQKVKKFREVSPQFSLLLLLCVLYPPSALCSISSSCCSLYVLFLLSPLNPPIWRRQKIWPVGIKRTQCNVVLWYWDRTGRWLSGKWTYWMLLYCDIGTEQAADW